MEFQSNFVDRTGSRVDKTRNVRGKWRGYNITVNPNIPMSKADPDYIEFRDFFYYKIRQLYSRKYAQKYIVSQGNVKWDTVTTTCDTSFEYGQGNGCLHCHTHLLLRIPAVRGDKIKIDYDAFHRVAKKEIFTEPEFRGIYIGIQWFNVSLLNIREYNNKGLINTL